MYMWGGLYRVMKHSVKSRIGEPLLCLGSWTFMSFKWVFCSAEFISSLLVLICVIFGSKLKTVTRMCDLLERAEQTAFLLLCGWDLNFDQMCAWCGKKGRWKQKAQQNTSSPTPAPRAGEWSSVVCWCLCVFSVKGRENTVQQIWCAPV